MSEELPKMPDFSQISVFKEKEGEYFKFGELLDAARKSASPELVEQINELGTEAMAQVYGVRPKNY